jgi:Flp pilus assembly protein TadG
VPVTRGWRRRSRSSERGQSLAEFAIVAPIFFLLVFSVIQFGLIMAAQNGLVDGVRTAARRAATYRVNELSFDPTVKTQICTTVKNDVSSRLAKRVIGYNAANTHTTLTYEWVGTPEAGDYSLIVHIDTKYDNTLYVPLVSNFLDGTDGTVDGKLTLEASEQMRVENPPLTATSGSTETC